MGRTFLPFASGCARRQLSGNGFLALFRSPAHILQRLPFLCLKKLNVLCSNKCFSKNKKKIIFIAQNNVVTMRLFLPCLFFCLLALMWHDFLFFFFHSHATGDERQCMAKKGMFNESCELVLHSSIFRWFC